MRTLLVVALLLLVCRAAADAQPPLLIGSAFEPPISTRDQEGIADGVVREAFARIGQEAEIIRLPSERSLINAAQGINDGDLIRVAGLQRQYPDLVQVPEKIIDFEFVAFRKDPEIAVRDWDDLSPYSVGIVRGWKILQDKATCTHLTQVDDLDLLFTLLEKGRADLVIYERRAGLAALEKLHVEGVLPPGPPLETQPMFLYLHKRHKALVGALESALREMKRDGTYQRIVRDALHSSLRETSAWTP